VVTIIMKKSYTICNCSTCSLQSSIVVVLVTVVAVVVCLFSSPSLPLPLFVLNIVLAVLASQILFEIRIMVISVISVYLSMSHGQSSQLLTVLRETLKLVSHRPLT